MRPFWLKQALCKDGELAPALSRSRFADICMVGDGYTGLWTAIQTKLKNPKLDIVILEGDICGAGASARNGGCVLTGSAKSLSLCQLSGDDEAVHKSGSVKNMAGVFSPFAAAAQPVKLVHGLRRVALQIGTRIHECSPMTGFDKCHPAVMHTLRGSVTASQLVRAASAWMASMFAQSGRSSAIVSGVMLITGRCPELLKQAGRSHGPLSHFPPEPFRYAGFLLVRHAIRRKERTEDDNHQPGLVDKWLNQLASTAGKADKAWVSHRSCE